MKKKINTHKKKRIAFKRPHDFWTGFVCAFFIVFLTCIFIPNMSDLLKSIILALILITGSFVFYVNKTSKIVKASFKSLLRWKKKKSVEEYSVAIEYQTLLDMVESKKKLEEALKMVEDLESDQKITDFIKNIKNNNNKDIWKN